jgi:hypothetical protein
MPTGTGAITLSQIPDVPFVIDPGQFFDKTEQQIFQAMALPLPGPGSFVPFNLPRTGVLSKLTVTFVGTLTIANAAVTPSWLWPYGILQGFVLSANGQNDLFECNGIDLAVLREARYPYFVDHVDMFPGAIGGGSPIAIGTYPIFLTFEVPVAIDDTTLGASLFLQSSSTNIRITMAQELTANLISAGAAANWTLAGNFLVEPDIWKIPYGPNGELVLPDISRIHTLVANEIPFQNTGDVQVPLIRTAGQMERLFVRAFGAYPNTPLTAAPGQPANTAIDQIRLQYGGNQKPEVYNPAARLLSRNSQWYGATLPYDALCFDRIRENPVRDLVYYQGVTELQTVLTVDPAVVPGVGCKVRTVQESLI